MNAYGTLLTSRTALACKKWSLVAGPTFLKWAVYLRHRSLVSWSTSLQRQPSRGVLRKKCPENMQKIYWKTPTPKCDFNNLFNNFIEITLRHRCSPVNLLNIFRTSFLKNASSVFAHNAANNLTSGFDNLFASGLAVIFTAIAAWLIYSSLNWLTFVLVMRLISWHVASVTYSLMTWLLDLLVAWPIFTVMAWPTSSQVIWSNRMFAFMLGNILTSDLNKFKELIW